MGRTPQQQLLKEAAFSALHSHQCFLTDLFDITQDELEELFVALDKAHFGQETGSLNKSDLRIALETYFRVGMPGGKSLDHFDELMQALDEDQEEEKFEHKKLFEEDREFNQGETMQLRMVPSFALQTASACTMTICFPQTPALVSRVLA